MLNTIGRRYPVYFIGNAPMAHLHLPKNGADGSGETGQELLL